MTVSVWIVRPDFSKSENWSQKSFYHLFRALYSFYTVKGKFPHFVTPRFLILKHCSHWVKVWFKMIVWLKSSQVFIWINKTAKTKYRLVNCLHHQGNENLIIHLASSEKLSSVKNAIPNMIHFAQLTSYLELRFTSR